MEESGLLLGPGLGFGLNAFVAGLVGLHVLALVYWAVHFMQDSTKATSRNAAALKKRQ